MDSEKVRDQTPLPLLLIWQIFLTLPFSPFFLETEHLLGSLSILFRFHIQANPIPGHRGRCFMSPNPILARPLRASRIASAEKERVSSHDVVLLGALVDLIPEHCQIMGCSGTWINEPLMENPILSRKEGGRGKLPLMGCSQVKHDVIGIGIYWGM